LRAKVDVLVVGDFPPRTFTGISMVNALVKGMLEAKGKIVVAIDESAWRLKGLGRIFHYFSRYVDVARPLVSCRVEILYTNIPLSRFGLLRLILLCFFARIISWKTTFYGHIHRGDIRSFFTSSHVNRFLLKLSLSFFNRIIVLSKQFADEVKAINSNQVFILPNTSLLEGYGKGRQYQYNRSFLCVSNIIRSKGIGELVEAFSSPELTDFKLAIVGNIYENDFYRELVDVATPNVEFHLSKSREVVAEMMSAYGCLVLPSWNEGQPLVILEAMSLGIPVIATRVGDIPDMLGEDYAFLFNPREPNMLLKTILNFDEVPGKDEIGKVLLNRYMANYSQDVFKRNIYELFKVR